MGQQVINISKNYNNLYKNRNIKNIYLIIYLLVNINWPESIWSYHDKMVKNDRTG